MNKMDVSIAGSVRGGGNGGAGDDDCGGAAGRAEVTADDVTTDVAVGSTDGLASADAAADVVAQREIAIAAVWVLAGVDDGGAEKLRRARADADAQGLATSVKAAAAVLDADAVDSKLAPLACDTDAAASEVADPVAEPKPS